MPRFSRIGTPKVVATPKPTVQESLAKTIKRVSKALEELSKTGLNEEAVMILLMYKTRLGRKTIDKVLSAVRSLAEDYTK